MPHGIHKNKTCSENDMPVFIANPHQIAVRDYLINSTYKGLLLYHKLGSGKTCTAILSATELLILKKIKHVFILTPGSLRTNWLYEYCNTCGVGSDRLRDDYTFITYNYNISEQLENEDFNESLIIIDEFHNVINGVKNKTETFVNIYNKINQSTCMVLLLSATPIIKDPISEWELIFPLLDPTISADTNYEQLKGIVSYFESDDNLYPPVYYKDPIKTNMISTQQLSFRKLMRYETMIRTNGVPKLEDCQTLEEYKKKQRIYILAMKFFFSRKVSNCYYPSDIREKPDVLKIEKVDYDKVVSLELQKEAEEELQIFMDNNPLTQDEIESKSKLKPKLLSGWVDKESLSDKKLLLEYSPKFTSLIINILLNLGTKHLIYSIYKSKGGVVLLNTLLNKCGIKAAIFSGDLNDSKRLKLLKKYNSPENRDGELITVLLITEAGEQGLTLLETNHVHIVESSRYSYKTQQAIGRVVRYKSHVNLPQERNFVNVYRYWSIIDGEKGIDEILFEKSKENKDIIDKFNLGLQNISI
jgi:superfamily II DNA or RNA helicase